ncbi:MAG TPA: hydroxypyruvate isomerase [Symbiobacteriaceae bacterium]
MPKFAANLSMLFTEHPFLDRFAAARKAGFEYVEFLFPYEYKQEELVSRVRESGVQVVLFNLPSGNWAGGERGIAADPARVEEFRAGVKEAIAWAKLLGVPRMNALAGKVNPAYSREEHWRTLVENVRYAADALAEAGLQLVVEPINHFDIPGFFLNTVQQAAQLIDEVGRPNVAIQFDVYHVQREEGNITPTLRQYFNKIGHIQVADNPGRHQPGTGEINYPFIFRELDRLGYQGYVAGEYIPEPSTLQSLDWLKF